jgi:N-hydroxyarylamine O-acetyltransferase
MFNDTPFDLDRYLARIGYSGARRATREVLDALALRHPMAIPFENLDPFLGRPVNLDLESLQRKIVTEGRGGYCFEHNLLIGRALTALGFTVTGLGARVLYNHPPGIVTARTHMVLLVDLEGVPHVVDGGFGGLTLTGVLRFEPDIPQDTPHGRFRLRQDRRDQLLEVELRDEWRPLYRFTLEPQYLPDYQVANWYVSTSPASPFVSQLIAARVDVNHRYALRNLAFTVHRSDGSSESRLLTEVDEIVRVLEQDFHIRVPRGPELTAALARLVAAGA